MELDSIQAGWFWIQLTSGAGNAITTRTEVDKFTQGGYFWKLFMEEDFF